MEQWRKLLSLLPQSTGFLFSLLKRDYGPEKREERSQIYLSSLQFDTTCNLKGGGEEISRKAPLILRNNNIQSVCSVRYFTNSSQEIKKDLSALLGRIYNGVCAGICILTFLRFWASTLNQTDHVKAWICLIPLKIIHRKDILTVIFKAKNKKIKKIAQQ